MILPGRLANTTILFHATILIALTGIVLQFIGLMDYANSAVSLSFLSSIISILAAIFLPSRLACNLFSISIALLITFVYASSKVFIVGSAFLLTIFFIWLMLFGCEGSKTLSALPQHFFGGQHHPDDLPNKAVSVISQRLSTPPTLSIIAIPKEKESGTLSAEFFSAREAYLRTANAAADIEIAPSLPPLTPETQANRATVFEHEIRAIYEYESDPSDPMEISFQKGEILYAATVTGTRWWNARNQDGKIGIVPSNYMEVIHKINA